MTNPSEKKRLDSEAKLQLARAKAMDGYAMLEQGLCGVFARAGDMRDEVAGVVFYRLTNTRSRLAIIDKLVRIKLGKDDAKHRPFVNSVIKAVKALDQTRNEVAHWHPAVHIYADPDETHTAYEVELMPPNFWGWDSNTPSHSDATLTAFADECDAYARALNLFAEVLRGERQLPPSLDIFREPLVYPLPAGHPLART